MRRERVKMLPLLFVSLLVMGQTSPANAPVIAAVDPSSGAPGASVSITGHGFAPDNTVIFGTTRIAPVTVASAIAITCTTNPNCRPGVLQMLKFMVPKFAPGRVQVSVSNVNGTSNAVDFTVLQ